MRALHKPVLSLRAKRSPAVAGLRRFTPRNDQKEPFAKVSEYRLMDQVSEVLGYYSITDNKGVMFLPQRKYRFINHK